MPYIKLAQNLSMSRVASERLNAPELINILTIEDNVLDQRMLANCLKGSSSFLANITVASSLREGLQQLEARTFDILFLDLNLPDSDGLKTVADVTDQAPSTPIVVITGEDEEAFGEEAIRLGAQDFLVKGELTSSGVKAATRYAIERHKLYHQMERLIEENADAILVLNKGGIIRYANKAASELFQTMPSKLIGKNLDVNLNDVSQVELDIPLIDGTSRIAALHATPTIWAGSAAYLATLHDISRQKEKEQRLITKWEMADAINKSKTKFMANMSHELRTPLNSVIGFSDFILSEANGPIGQESYKEYLKNISDCGNILLTQINDLLDLAKVDANELALRIDEVNISRLINQTVRILSLQADVAGIKLIEDVDEVPFYIWGDAHRLGQIIRNLVSNALNYTTKGGAVTLSLKEVGAGVKLTVQDTGCGIKKSDLDRVFEPFVQCHDSNDNAASASTGLGLPLVKHLVHLHGGRIELESELGKGTLVTVHLPKNLAKV